MLNHDRIGHTYPAFTYEVTRPKVCEYAIATGIGDPVYRSDPADVPSVQVPVPPTFAACFTIGAGGVLHDDPDLGAHWNLVHGGQEYEFHRPLRIGDVLTCVPRISDIRARGRMEILTLDVDCADAATGAPVLTSRGTIIFFSEEG